MTNFNSITIVTSITIRSSCVVLSQIPLGSILKEDAAGNYARSNIKLPVFCYEIQFLNWGILFFGRTMVSESKLGFLDGEKRLFVQWKMGRTKTRLLNGEEERLFEGRKEDGRDKDTNLGNGHTEKRGHRESPRMGGRIMKFGGRPRLFAIHSLMLSVIKVNRNLPVDSKSLDQTRLGPAKTRTVDFHCQTQKPAPPNRLVYIYTTKLRDDKLAQAVQTSIAQLLSRFDSQVELATLLPT